MNRRALITGAYGFAGRVLREYLAGQGWDTVCSDARVPPDDAAGLACDVSDLEQVDHLYVHAGPVTHVFHLAAVTFVPESGQDPARTFEVNLLGTVYMLRALTRHAPQARFINVASSEIYGHPVALPITEDHPIVPVNPYAISKAAADAYCGYVHASSHVDVVRMRPFNHSGPGQSDRFALSSFARQIARIEAGRAEPVLRVGNLEPARDFLHVRDVVRAYERAALHGRAGEAYNICSGVSVPIEEALRRLLKMTPVAIRVEQDPARLRPVEVREVRGSAQKLTRDTGWQPALDLDAVLRDLIGYWRENDTTP